MLDSIALLRMATGGIHAGKVVRIIESGATNVLITTDIHCDETRPIHPRDIVWEQISNLRPLNDMETIGAMAL